MRRCISSAEAAEKLLAEVGISAEKIRFLSDNEILQYSWMGRKGLALLRAKHGMDLSQRPLAERVDIEVYSLLARHIGVGQKEAHRLARMVAAYFA